MIRNRSVTIWVMVIGLCLSNSPVVLADCPSADLTGPDTDIASAEGIGVKDCKVDFYDLSALVLHWLNTCSYPYWCDEADFDESGLVNFTDFANLANEWMVDASVCTYTWNVTVSNPSASVRYHHSAEIVLDDTFDWDDIDQELASLRFVDPNGVVFSHWVEYLDYGTKAVVWVRIPKLLAGGNVFEMRYSIDGSEGLRSKSYSARLTRPSAGLTLKTYPRISFAVTGGNQGAKQFTIAGVADPTALRFYDGATFTIEDSTGNDGSYTVDGASSESVGVVTITVNEAISSATFDGTIIERNLTTVHPWVVKAQGWMRYSNATVAAAGTQDVFWVMVNTPYPQCDDVTDLAARTAPAGQWTRELTEIPALWYSTDANGAGNWVWPNGYFDWPQDDSGTDLENMLHRYDATLHDLTASSNLLAAPPKNAGYNWFDPHALWLPDLNGGTLRVYCLYADGELYYLDLTTSGTAWADAGDTGTVRFGGVAFDGWIHCTITGGDEFDNTHGNASGNIFTSPDIIYENSTYYMIVGDTSGGNKGMEFTKWTSADGVMWTKQSVTQPDVPTGMIGLPWRFGILSKDGFWYLIGNTGIKKWHYSGATLTYLEKSYSSVYLTFPIYTVKKHIFLLTTSKSYQIHLGRSRIFVFEAVLLKIGRNTWFSVSYLSSNTYFCTDRDRSHFHKYKFFSNSCH